jgi:hypothetical protein
MLAGVAAANGTESALSAETPVFAQEARRATLATPKEKVASVVFMFPPTYMTYL